MYFQAEACKAKQMKSLENIREKGTLCWFFLRGGGQLCEARPAPCSLRAFVRAPRRLRSVSDPAWGASGPPSRHRESGPAPGGGEGPGSMWQSIGLTLLVIVATLACVLLFMLCGWYVVWQLFLSKFKFLRELIGDTGSQQGDNETSETEAEQETPPSPQRGRQKSARQRRAPAEETT